jgi:glycosyltransferase involved in cell wall biosynthesis
LADVEVPNINGRKPLRVLQVTPRVFPYMGGVETHVREVAKRLGAHGVQTEILTADPSHELAPADTLEGVPVTRLRAWPRGRDYMLAPFLAAAIGRRRPDVIHVQSYHTLLAPHAMAAAIRQNIPFVVTFHGGGHSSPLRTAIRTPQLRVLGLLLRRAAALVSIADFEIERYGRLAGLSSERFASIPNGSDLPAPTGSGAREPGRLIVSSGRLERYKGHHRVVDAFPHVLREIPDARLWIAGGGPYEPELREQVAGLGLAAKVEIGAVDRATLAARLSGASLGVMLSDFESQPLAALEALSLGVPLVVANNSGLAELADKGMARSVELPGSPQSHARAMIEQIQDPLPVPELELPTWDGCAAALADLYRAVSR